MPSLARSTTATLIPAMRYRDAAAAVDWLCRAFGFEKHAVHTGDDGMIVHAELRFGNGMIMLSATRDDEFGRLVDAPADPEAPAGQCIYVVVTDADAHHARAVAEGARIVMALKDQDYGSREYVCRDPEGHVWCFGTYDPWSAPAAG